MEQRGGLSPDAVPSSGILQAESFRKRNRSQRGHNCYTWFRKNTLQTQKPRYKQMSIRLEH